MPSLCTRIACLVVLIALLATASNAETAASLSSSAHAAYDGGNLTQAETLFKDVLTAHPSETALCADAQYWLGWIADKRGDKSAETVWKVVAEKYPDSTQAPMALERIAGLHYRAKVSRDSLVAEHQQIVARYPSSPEAIESKYRMGKLWVRRPPDFGKALAEFQSAMDSNVETTWRAESMVDIGLTYLQRFYNQDQKDAADLDTALKTLADVRNKFPAEATAISRGEIRLARYHLEVKKDPAKAATLLKDIVAKYPQSDHIVEAKYHLATCANAQGDRKGCIEQCKQTRAQYPDSPWCDYILYYTANCLYLDGQKQAAIDALNDVIRLYPTSQWVPIAKGTLSKIAPAGGQ